MPLYLITLHCSQFPGRQTSRVVERPDLPRAIELAEERLAAARMFGPDGEDYDSWSIAVRWIIGESKTVIAQGGEV